MIYYIGPTPANIPATQPRGRLQCNVTNQSDMLELPEYHTAVSDLQESIYV